MELSNAGRTALAQLIVWYLEKEGHLVPGASQRPDAASAFTDHLSDETLCAGFASALRSFGRLES